MVIKKSLILILLSFAFVFPLISAAIVIDTQPISAYNLGDIATVKVTFKPAQTVSGNFQMDLLCGQEPLNFYKSGVHVPVGSQKVIESSLILIKDIIGSNKGTCTIKAYFGNDFALTDDFLISDFIKVNSTLDKTEFSPGETINVKGNAVKDNGKMSNGYVQLSLVDGNGTVVEKNGTINNGIYLLSIDIPKDARSGNYFVRTVAHEEDVSGQTTNLGSLDIAIFVKQVPTTLEIVFEKSNGTEIKILPGEILKVKGVLRDQSGESIDSETFLTIKNNKNKILEQTELPTDDFFSFEIPRNEPSATWKVVAVSNKLITEKSFSIMEKESADVEIENNTILITNTGNVPYNKTVLVKVGNQSLNIDVYLEVDESRRWLLTAPNGEYNISVASDKGVISTTAILTGNAIDVKKASAGIGSLVKFPAVWIFIIAVLCLMTIIVFRRGYQKAFIGYITEARKNSSVAAAGSSGAFGVVQKSKAEMVLSIKGDKQEVSMITLNIKNLAWIKNVKEGNASETIEKVIDVAENSRATTYDNGEYISLIFAPARTKTFKNEATALKIAKEIKDILNRHNKMFKQKIEFGISLNVGEIIAKQDSESFKFMGMGNFLTSSKKIASAADNDILMGEKITDNLKTMIKTEKHEKGGMKVYSIKEIKDTARHDKFLKGFMKRQTDDDK